MEKYIVKPIGYIETPWKTLNDMPIQPLGAEKVKGKIQILPEYRHGLKDLEGFSHVTLLYKLHRIEKYDLEVIPFMDKEKRGVFSTRSPRRPNAIGLSTVELLKVENDTLYISGVDMLNGTPLLDIKPFLEKFDNRYNTRSGWLSNYDMDKIKNTTSDMRFFE